jgi:Flp pilus assembly protein TadG
MQASSHTRQNRKLPRLRLPYGRTLLRALRREDGQAMVELALVLPILLLAVFGITDFGRALNDTEQATNLANEAARYAAVGQVPTGATGTLGSWMLSQADSSELKGSGSVCVNYPSVTTNGQTTSRVAGDPVTVSVSFTYSWIPLLGLGPSSTITRSATMRIESPPTNSFYNPTC